MSESERLKLWPVAIIEDRYNGAYSGGRWLAIAEADMPETGYTNRAAMVLEDGPHGDDTDAMLFWSDPPPWIAAGISPDAACAALRAKMLEPSHD